VVQIRRGEIDEEALTESQEQEGMLLKKRTREGMYGRTTVRDDAVL
jgi:hypothetical protein